MIPTANADIEGIKITVQPSKTYALDLERNVIRGYCDGVEAVKQAVYKILNTERYDWLIYSRNYGIELKELYGTQTTYAMPRLKGRIEEALLQDSRIKEIKDFSVKKETRNTLHASFTVVSTEGEFESGVTVNV
ncbi:MAG: DUF2634 domain-containing protein [Candidatus Metalachnospira sp.]|nr:DUF2634 domain-containing protein [Candidatus Metalachnospira sp.]